MVVQNTFPTFLSLKIPSKVFLEKWEKVGYKLHNNIFTAKKNWLRLCPSDSTHLERSWMVCVDFSKVLFLQAELVDVTVMVDKVDHHLEAVLVKTAEDFAELFQPCPHRLQFWRGFCRLPCCPAFL